MLGRRNYILKEVIFWIIGLVTSGIVLQKPVMVADLYADQIAPTQTESEMIPELNFLMETLKIVNAHGWGGQPNEALAVTKDDFDSQLMAQWESAATKREQKLMIPEESAPLYTQAAAQTEMVELIRQARQEFLEYAKQKSTAAYYLKEIENNTLPDEAARIHYYVKGRTSNTHTYDHSPPGDFSQVQMDIYASNVYKNFRDFQEAGLVSDERAGRDLALRYVVYHEMVHVLQQAVDVMNAPLQDKKNWLPWLQARRRILNIDSRYYQTWGRETDAVTRNFNNLTIAKESQAEGVAIEMLGEVYHLSAVQKQRLWDCHFGSLEEGKKTLDEILKRLESEDPAVNLETFAHQLRTALPDKKFTDYIDRLDGNMASHIGYLHPMTHDESMLFWKYLKQ